MNKLINNIIKEKIIELNDIIKYQLDIFKEKDNKIKEQLISIKYLKTVICYY